LVGVSETDAQAEADYADAADYFYNKCLHVYPGFAEAPGYRSIETIRAGIRPQIGEEAKRIRENLRWKDFIEQGYVIAGSPATVRERLREAIKMLNVGHLMVLCQFGNLDQEHTRKNTALFAQEVMPSLRDLWSEWRDYWWPKPMAERAVPRG
jgi:alkanesulfonate monooxygenase SsuD/methylene tetrahydromethanopterin reductase-like flavin-dependent oxidoreductase (luciferase family)